MKKLYWINGIGFIDLLKRYGYKWNSGENVGNGMGIMERIMEDAYAHVITVDHFSKIIGVYPLEIYAADSPTANAEKYKNVVDGCGSFDDLKNDVILVNNKGEKAC